VSELKKLLTETIEVSTLACPGCGEKIKVTVNKAGYFAWRAGELLQRALPELSVSARERFISGYCTPCWDELVEDDETPLTEEELATYDLGDERQLTHKDGSEL
jgi:hypothetical protein